MHGKYKVEGMVDGEPEYVVNQEWSYAPELVEEALWDAAQADAPLTARVIAAEVLALRDEVARWQLAHENLRKLAASAQREYEAATVRVLNLERARRYSTEAVDALFTALDDARYSGTTNLNVIRAEGLDDVADALETLRDSREPKL